MFTDMRIRGLHAQAARVAAWPGASFVDWWVVAVPRSDTQPHLRCYAAVNADRCWHYVLTEATPGRRSTVVRLTFVVERCDVVVARELTQRLARRMVYGTLPVAPTLRTQRNAWAEAIRLELLLLERFGPIGTLTDEGNG